MKNILFSCLLLLSLAVQAQSDYSKLDLNFGLGTNIYSWKAQPVWNLQGELHINARWSLLYNYNLGSIDTNNLYFHAPMSLYAVGPVTRFLAQNSYTITDFFSSLAVGLLTALIPEGVAYHYPLAYRYDLSTYANPLGLAFVFSTNPALDQRIRYQTNVGVKLTYYSRLGLIANVHTQLNYTGYYGFYQSAGLGIGYAFGSRNLGTD
ncbi:MAG: hypothetical protein ACKOWX_08690 [Flavobacteriales bacterium]